MRAIDGSLAFNSGKPVVNNSFLHTFEEEGTYCVVSEGAPNTYCIIQVLRTATKADAPQLVNQDPQVLYKNHRIFLHSHTPNVSIHYTTDGSAPNKLSAVRRQQRRKH